MSATVPMEFQFGSAGNLKSARRLRNLDLKKKRPTIHPLFGNTGSVVGQAYAATNQVKANRAGPLYGGAKPGPITGKNAVPILNPNIAAQQGDELQGGQILPSKAVQNPVVPSGESPQKIVAAAEKRSFFSSGKNVLLAGGGLVGLVILVYMMFFNKKTKHKRRKNGNGNKKANGKRGRR